MYSTIHLLEIMLLSTISLQVPSNISILLGGNSVAGRHHVDADPDPAFHFDADPDPDATFHSNADPDPDPTFKFDAAPDSSTHFSPDLDPPMLQNDIFTLMRIRIMLFNSLLIRILLFSSLLIRI
jgi:hypothetical protein